MKYTVEHIIYNIKDTCLGWNRKRFDDVLENLLYAITDKIGHPIIGDQYYNLTFFMNPPFYHEFCITCDVTGHNSDMYRGIKIIVDPTILVGDSKHSDGIVRLLYKEPTTNAPIRVPTTNMGIEINRDLYDYCVNDAKTIYELYLSSVRKGTPNFLNELVGLDRGHGFNKVPHIDHVKFNGPATIVFWKDGTKTVVKHDGKGRKDKRLAVLYAFIRKIYGEGRPYNNILNEIEEALK